MFGFLDNCVNYGADVLSTNTEYRRCILEIFDMCMTSRALGAEDRVIGCKLAEAMLLRLRGQVDEVSGRFHPFLHEPIRVDALSSGRFG